MLASRCIFRHTLCRQFVNVRPNRYTNSEVLVVANFSLALIFHLSIWQLRKVCRFYRLLHTEPTSGVPIGLTTGKQPSGWQMTKKLVRHVWPPKGHWNVKRKVLVAAALLISAKLLNATVPFILRDIIDYFNGKLPEDLTFGFATASQAVFSTGIALILAYGAARAGTSFFNEVRETFRIFGSGGGGA